jgi:hypothetical protein
VLCHDAILKVILKTASLVSFKKCNIEGQKAEELKLIGLEVV